jgi:hypothetical protein
MSDREQKANEIHERSSDRRESSDKQKRMGQRLKDDTPQEEDDTPQEETEICQGTIRNDDQCSNDATEGQYCDKHQPNEYGELTWQYERKQWYLQEDFRDQIFGEPKDDDDDDLLDESTESTLYNKTRLEIGSSISQKSFENTAAEFLLEYSDEFIEFAVEKYSDETDD